MKTTGYIDQNGRYIRGVDKSLGHDINPTYKEYSHEIGRKEYAKEIIQPHAGGKPNPEFVRNYPEVSKEYWSQEQIDQAERKLS